MMIFRRLRDRIAERRSRRSGATVPTFTARTLDATTPLPLGPCVLWFDAEPDAPYRLRRWLRHGHVVAATADTTTATRLALLTTRHVHTQDRRAAMRLATELAIRGASDQAAAPPSLPASQAAPHIVLQVGDFTEGGMEQVVIDLADALIKDAMRVTILVLGRTGSAAARAAQRGLTLHRLDPTAAAYTEFLTREGVDLVNAHYATFGAELCVQASIPFVQTIHNMYMWFGAPERQEYRAADRHTRAYVCVSNNVARYADVALGLRPDRMLVIPNGCDRAYVQPRPSPERIVATRRALGVPDDAPFFLHVASIQPAKAQHLLLAAFHQVANACPRAHLVFLGQPMDAEYARTLEQRTHGLGLASRVHWAGQRPDVSTIHAAAGALVIPSFFEGWSLAITEAVLAGLPVIATDVGGASEQLEGTDGILLPAAAPDPTAIDAERLLPLLQAPCAPLRARLAAALQEVYGRDGKRSPLPPDWERLLRECAYARYAHVFRCLLAGGSPAAARAWTEPARPAVAVAASATIPSRPTPP